MTSPGHLFCVAKNASAYVSIGAGKSKFAMALTKKNKNIFQVVYTPIKVQKKQTGENTF